MSVLEVQTVASFMPHLVSDDSRAREAAFVTMSALGNTALVARLAGIYKDEAAFGALSRIASGLDPAAAEVAERSLDELLRSAVVRVGVADRAFATGFAVAPDLVVTADYLVQGSDATADPVTVTPFEQSTRTAELVGVDSTHGVALVRVADVRLAPLPIHESDPNPEEAGELSMLDSAAWRMRVGRIHGTAAGPLPSMPAQLVLLRGSIESEPGAGGAPVVDRRGRVVAMHYASGGGPDQREALLVPATTLRAGLAALGLRL